MNWLWGSQSPRSPWLVLLVEDVYNLVSAVVDALVVLLEFLFRFIGYLRVLDVQDVKMKVDHIQLESCNFDSSPDESSGVSVDVEVPLGCDDVEGLDGRAPVVELYDVLGGDLNFSTFPVLVLLPTQGLDVSLDELDGCILDAGSLNLVHCYLVFKVKQNVMVQR